MGMAHNRPDRITIPDGGTVQADEIDPADLSEGDEIVLSDGNMAVVTGLTPDPLAAADEPDWQIDVLFQDGFETTISETYLERLDDVEVHPTDA